MFPIGDTPNPRNFNAWVNWALIAANVLIYLLVTLPAGDQYGAYVLEHGFKPGAAEGADLAYSMFLHGGPGHLAGNMLFLWIYGDNVEHRLGRGTYLAVYLGCGVAATLTFAFFAGGSTVPMVGASGAIAGVLGLYFLLFPRNKVKVFVFFFPFIMDVFLVPARLVLGAFVLLDNFLPVLLGANSNVAYGAHLGGFFAGLLVAWIGERRGWKLAPAGPPPPSVSRSRVRPARALSEADLARRHLDTGLELQRRGQDPMAWQHFARVLELNADPETKDRAVAALSAIDAHPKLHH